MDGLYNGESIVPVILITGILGGGAAWMSGRAIANAWQPVWQVVVTALLLGAAARFLHFALFDGMLLSVASYCLDSLFVLVVGLVAWRATRTGQMVRQYPWLCVRTGPLTWREIGQQSRPQT